MENVYCKETGTYGNGVFAGRGFKEGEVVLTFCGPIGKTATIHTVPITSDLSIDPLPPGRFLNHSCEPSCGIKNRTEVVAMRDIDKDEEITIDYAMIVDEYDDPDQDLTCRCGSKYCRGKLGSYNTLPEEVKRKYEGLVSDYLVEGQRQ